MDIFTLQEVSKDQQSIITYFSKKHIIHDSVFCDDCTRDYSMIKEKAKLNGFIWRCPGCKSKQSILTGSYFANAHLSLTKLAYLCYYWATKTPLSVTKQHLSLSQNTGVDWYQYMRDICSWKLLQEPIRLGGPGVIVQIDESLMVKAKYNRRRNLTLPQRWVFGIYDESKKMGYIRFVDRRDAQTLLPIIADVILPSSIIHSDEWAAYNGITGIANRNYTHETVNHRYNFVNPISGAHTNNVENYWKRAKAVFKRMNGTKVGFVESYLDEFMWRERYGATFDLAYENLLCHIHEKHPC